MAMLWNGFVEIFHYFEHCNFSRFFWKKMQCPNDIAIFSKKTAMLMPHVGMNIVFFFLKKWQCCCLMSARYSASTRKSEKMQCQGKKLFYHKKTANFGFRSYGPLGY